MTHHPVTPTRDADSGTSPLAPGEKPSLSVSCATSAR